MGIFTGDHGKLDTIVEGVEGVAGPLVPRGDKGDTGLEGN